MTERSAADKVLDREQLTIRYGPGHRGRVVFTNGCFDLLHPGHVRYLEEARRLGDALVVGVNADESVRRLAKAPGRPVMDEGARAAVVAALEVVDAVCIFPEDTPEALIEALAPAVLVKGADYEGAEIAGRGLVEASGGRVEIVPLLEGYSSSGIITRILESNP